MPETFADFSAAQRALAHHLPAYVSYAIRSQIDAGPFKNQPYENFSYSNTLP